MTYDDLDIDNPLLDGDEEEIIAEVRAPQYAATRPVIASSIPTPSRPEPVEPAVSTTVVPAPSTATSDEPKPWYRDRTEEETAELNNRAKAGELLAGRKKPATYSFGWTTRNDLFLVWQVATGRYLKDTILQTSRGLKSKANIYTRLRQLQNAGLVRAVKEYGYDQLWLPTSLGRKFLEANGWGDAESFPVVGPDDIPKNLDHPLAENLVRAQLLCGGFYDLGFGQEGAAPVPLDRLVSEWSMRSSWSTITEIAKGEVEDLRHVKARKLRQSATKWVEDGRLTWARAFGQTPALWIPSDVARKGNSDDGREYIIPGRSHTPDLIVNRLTPTSELKVNTAIEIELTKKTVAEYERIFKLYLRDGAMYHRVVWITADERVDRVLQKAIENVPGAEVQNMLLRLDTDGLPLLKSVDEREKHRSMQSMKRKMPKHKDGTTSPRFVASPVDGLV